MTNNTASVLDLLGIEEQDLQMSIKERLSISALNVVLKAKEKTLQKKMRDEFLLSMSSWWVFTIICFSLVLVLSEDQESKAGGIKFTSWPLCWDNAWQLGQANPSAGPQAEQLTLKSGARTAKCTLNCPLHLRAHDCLSQPPGKYEQVYMIFYLQPWTIFW